MLWKQYEELRDSETMLWKQKSREKWIQEGDRNTKFFHLTTMVRRRKNKIDGLFDALGAWSDSPVVMKSIARNFFMELFAFQDFTFLTCFPRSIAWPSINLSLPLK